MRAVIIGAGKTGAYLAAEMVGEGHEVVLIDENVAVVEALPPVEGMKVMRADGCDPVILEEAGTPSAGLVVAVTGHDEDNLVASWLAKYVFSVPRVIARINNPKNQWLYTEEWGVDAPVSAVHVISKLIEEEATFGDLVTLIKLQEGRVSLVETKISTDCAICGRSLKEVALPPSTSVVALLRDGQVTAPTAETRLDKGDELLLLTSPESEAALAELLKTGDVPGN